ncbi:hypothetical protein HMPREF9439_01084 [Parasutterella excrementihominis YIT 11859]|uniref:Uncharacterized protein n=1 Tax=Parasutterella excrementihominis YIT 11859 TaxID=762966 RepID=F3QJI2_9BURK|nr:hypothetical protein HMPREF9439_01084 [Parasutterella excrementihominis YIT 11859]
MKSISRAQELDSAKTSRFRCLVPQKMIRFCWVIVISKSQ